MSPAPAAGTQAHRWAVPLQVVVLLPVVGLSWGCSGRHATKLEGQYAVAEAPAGWQETAPGGADRAWYNPELTAAIYTDSNCGKRFEDGPVGDLAKHLVAGIATGDPISEQTSTLDGREAMTRVVRGRLDGVPVQVGATVMKKHECVYDFLYIAPPSRFDEGWPDFVDLVGSFHTPDPSTRRSAP